MLDGHDGKCQNLHGHTYKLEIIVSAPVIQGGAKDGMVMDFTDLKTIVKQHITDPFDHAFIYHGNNERESQIAALLESWNMKTLRLPCRTTAENMSVENVWPSEKCRCQSVQRETMGNADVVCGI